MENKTPLVRAYSPADTAVTFCAGALVSIGGAIAGPVPCAILAVAAKVSGITSHPLTAGVVAGSLVTGLGVYSIYRHLHGSMHWFPRVFATGAAIGAAASSTLIAVNL